jgi:hypothetical protein
MKLGEFFRRGLATSKVWIEQQQEVLEMEKPTQPVGQTLSYKGGGVRSSMMYKEIKTGTAVHGCPPEARVFINIAETSKTATPETRTTPP